MQILFSLCPDPSPPQEILVSCVRRRLERHPNLGGREGMGANQLCRIMFGISSQIGRDGHRDMGDLSTYGKIIRNLLGSMKCPGSNLCADTRRYKYLRASLGVKMERDLH